LFEATAAKRRVEASENVVRSVLDSRRANNVGTSLDFALVCGVD
jgi:hypothetical protein